jgi:hypothetical protein
MYDKTDAACFFCNETSPEITFDERQERRQRFARTVRDVLQPDNPADCICTIQVSGNALLRVLNAAEQAEPRARAQQEAETGVVYPDALELYAIIDQLRDQLAENRMRPR